jgi:hypothetical protein
MKRESLVPFSGRGRVVHACIMNASEDTQSLMNLYDNLNSFFAQ